MMRTSEPGIRDDVTDVHKYPLQMEILTDVSLKDVTWLNVCVFLQHSLNYSNE